MTNATTAKREQLKPPISNVGIIGWLKSNLFSTWYNSLLSVIMLGMLALMLPPVFQWAFVDSLWYSSAEACRNIEGACWSVVPHNFRFIILGFSPKVRSGDRFWQWFYCSVW